MYTMAAAGVTGLCCGIQPTGAAILSSYVAEKQVALRLTRQLMIEIHLVVGVGLTAFLGSVMLVYAGQVWRLAMVHGHAQQRERQTHQSSSSSVDMLHRFSW